MVSIKNNIILLIGMTGCGKSAVGRVLAKRAGAKLVDLDDEIVARLGSIRQIFDEQGEAAFREIEMQTLADVIAEANGALTVLSCGGGLPTWEPSRKLLRESTTVIWLRRSPEAVAANADVLARPPVNGSVENYRRLLAARYPLYRECAELSFYNAFPQRTAASILKKMMAGNPRG